MTLFVRGSGAAEVVVPAWLGGLPQTQLVGRGWRMREHIQMILILVYLFIDGKNIFCHINQTPKLIDEYVKRKVNSNTQGNLEQAQMIPMVVTSP